MAARLRAEQFHQKDELAVFFLSPVCRASLPKSWAQEKDFYWSIQYATFSLAKNPSSLRALEIERQNFKARVDF